MKVVSVFLVGLFLCASSEAVQKVDKKNQVTRSVIKSESAVIPVEVQAIIEKQLAKEGESLEKTVRRENLPVEIVIDYSKGDINFTKKILTPFGQSKLDLYKYLKDKPHQFKVTFAIKTENLSLDGLRVFFKPFIGVAQSGDKKCHQFLDVTSFYQRVMSKGFNLTTQANQFLNVLAGQFFFVINNNNKLHIALIEIGHSRLKHKMDCY